MTTTIINSLDRTITEQGYVSALFECIELLSQHHLQASYYYSLIVKKLTLNLIILFFKEKEQGLAKESGPLKNNAYKYLLYLRNVLEVKFILYQSFPIIYRLYMDFLNAHKALFLRAFTEMGFNVIPVISENSGALSLMPFFMAWSAPAIPKPPESCRMNASTLFWGRPFSRTGTGASPALCAC